MKIGIFTFHNSYNFGANLQTLATQLALQEQSATPVVINYVDRRKLAYYDRIVPVEQADMHRQFAARYLQLSPELYSSEEVEAYCLDSLDAVVVGSDAVFRLGQRYEPKRMFRNMFMRDHASRHFTSDTEFPPYWLDWQTRTKTGAFAKMSIAASATGTRFYLISADFFRKALRSLKDFDHVTVRDDWTALMVSTLSLGACRPVISPDPVLGLKRNLQLPEDEQPSEDFSSTVLISGNYPEAWRRALIEAIHGRGLRAATLPNSERDFTYPEADAAVLRPISPLRWYATLAACRGFVGRRFHAMVSCVANHVPVVSSEPRPRFDLLYKLRTKNCDLCRRAGMPGRFRTEAELTAMPAEAVLDLLFEPASHQAAMRYADTASAEFAAIIGRMVEVVAAKKQPPLQLATVPQV